VSFLAQPAAAGAVGFPGAGIYANDGWLAVSRQRRAPQGGPDREEHLSQQRSERPAGSDSGPARSAAGLSAEGSPGHAPSDRGAPASELPDLPEATVARLPEYLRALHVLADSGGDVVSSEELATAAGVNSAKLRKDLSYLRSNGTRGVGYDVGQLIDKIEHVLGLNQHRAVALVGVGNLGQALANYGGFGSRGFHIAALFDADPARIGERIAGLPVHHIDDLAEVVATEHIAIAVIATPAHAAQGVADALVNCGVTSILNFAPCVLSVPENVDVRKVDLAIELQILSFHEHRKATLTALPEAIS
jgi:redox-sensing transcriptional repressor